MILSERSDVTSLLDQLELSYERLVEVVRYADRERALCTANDPKGFPLIVVNARAARGLREAFCGDRWEIDETDNQPGIRNPHIKVRVIPCNFDQNAGNRLVDPSNRTEKGAASKRKVRCNATAWLPGLPEPQDDDEGEYTTYLLGIYSEEDDKLKAELSRPKAFSSGQYRSYTTRVILLNGSESLDPIANVHPERQGPTETVDIAISRK